MTMQNKRFLVIGGGQQGQIVAKELSRGNFVVLSDRREDLKAPCPDVQTQFFDARDAANGYYRSLIGSWFSTFDVVVSCLPSQFGGPCVELAAEYGVNYVDLSYTTDDLFSLDPLAQHTGSTIITDCGLAPGLPNLIAGRCMHLYAQKPGSKVPPINIYVGGVSKDPALPLGYVETWSLEDLYEEYVRMGRYVKNGKECLVSPTDMEALATVERFGQKFEAFTSDGLRTLMKFKNVVPNVREWTLRYPGHMKQVRAMLQEHKGVGLLPKEKWVQLFRSKLALNAKGGADNNKWLEADTVFLAVDCGDHSWEMKVHGTPVITAMSKTTAYTCAAMAEFLAIESDPKLDSPIQNGVMSMELIGRNHQYYSMISDALFQAGVKIL